MTKEPQWVTTTIDLRLHDLGDRTHNQLTFDPSNPLRPGRYWFGINPDDPTHPICADMQTNHVMGITNQGHAMGLRWVREVEQSWPGES